MSTPERNRSGAFQIEVGTMEGFLKLLGSREEEGGSSCDDALPRRAIFVAPLKHARLSKGIPSLPAACGPPSPTAPTSLPSPL